MIFLATGTANLGVNKLDKEGNVKESTKGRFYFTAAGPTVAVGEMDPETMKIKEDSVSFFGGWDAAGYLKEALDMLKPHQRTNIPDLAAITKALYKDGIDICEYCRTFNCRDCIVDEWKEEEEE